MSSALTFIILGNAYNIFGNSSQCRSNDVPIVEQPEPVPQFVPYKHQHHNYTIRIGSHTLHSKLATWNEARLICKEEGGDLAVINSAAEAEIIVRLLASSELNPEAAVPQFSLIGFHDIFAEGQYETVNGQSLSDAGYEEWVSGEPNGGNGENCGTISRDGKFNDGICSMRYNFVCEVPDAAKSVQTRPSVDMQHHRNLVTESIRSTTPAALEGTTATEIPDINYEDSVDYFSFSNDE